MMRVRQNEETSLNEVTQSNPVPVVVVEDQQTLNVTGRTDQVTVATTVTLILPANAERRSLAITNITGTHEMYLGYGPQANNAAWLTAHGHYLHSAAGSSITLNAHDAIYGVAISGTQVVSFADESVVR